MAWHGLAWLGMHTFHRLSNGCNTTDNMKRTSYHSFIRFRPATYMFKPSTKTKFSSSSNKYRQSSDTLRSNERIKSYTRYKTIGRTIKSSICTIFICFELCVCVSIALGALFFDGIGKRRKRRREKFMRFAIYAIRACTSDTHCDKNTRSSTFAEKK